MPRSVESAQHREQVGGGFLQITSGAEIGDVLGRRGSESEQSFAGLGPGGIEAYRQAGCVVAEQPPRRTWSTGVLGTGVDGDRLLQNVGQGLGRDRAGAQD